jgi:hypothetical protein
VLTGTSVPRRVATSKTSWISIGDPCSG